MKLPDPKLRLPLLLLLASLLLGAGIFHLSLNQRMRAEHRLIGMQAQADQAARSLREAPARLILDQTEAALHDTIRSSGFIGSEQRVGWISALAQSRAQLQLDSLAWHVSPQTASTLAPNLNVSRMEFTASRLDPDRLSELLAQLRSTAPGFFTVEQCQLTLDPNSAAGQANCHLNWWTLSPDED